MTSLNQIMVVATAAGLTTVTTTYAAGDTLGTIWSWDMGTNTYGIILGAQLIDTSDVLGATTLYLFDRSVTFGTDNAAPSISDADSLFSIGVIQIPPPDDLGGTRIASIDSLSVPVKANASGIIYGGLVTQTANAVFAGGATTVQINLHFTLDV